MRARAGDPPRTMPQKILAGRADDPLLSSDLVEAKVDQVILARDPSRTLGEAIERGLKKAAVETAIAYETQCVSSSNGLLGAPSPRESFVSEALSHGVLVARAGIGFPSAVHLERFAAPARLAVTDDPRVLSVGGAGMMTLVASPSQLVEALVKGTLTVRPPRSVQILLSGRLRPFVCVRDIALELMRRGLSETLERIDREHQAPVVLEFAGPSARFLSVPDRAVLCSLAPQLGAAGAVFVSDEKTEVYLRDQRRSKAHRTLVPDPGAPCDDVVTMDLSAVDPLLLDQKGEVRPVRDLEGTPVQQAVLGGDSGASLRDMLAAAALLKSKRVPPELDFLVAPPSRQVLEVLAQSGALVDLIATGARLIEPDHRVVSAELYPPPPGATSIRTFDPAPGTPKERGFVVASAETLAYSVSAGAIGDPRSFKRPVRVTVPRTLPTDDVLVVRKKKKSSKKAGEKESNGAPGPTLPTPLPWLEETTLSVVTQACIPEGPSALVLEHLDSVSWAIRNAANLAPHVRVVVSSFLPSGMVPVFSGLGILALSCPPEVLAKLRTQDSLTIPAVSDWKESATVTVVCNGEEHALTWQALGAERGWTVEGTSARPAPAAS